MTPAELETLTKRVARPTSPDDGDEVVSVPKKHLRELLDAWGSYTLHGWASAALSAVCVSMVWVIILAIVTRR
jgi:hypothetical protein